MPCNEGRGDAFRLSVARCTPNCSIGCARCILQAGESFRVNMTLAQIFEKRADERFVQCRRSVVVNLDYVRLLSEEMLTLADGTRISVGRRRMQEVRAAFKARRR